MPSTPIFVSSSQSSSTSSTLVSLKTVVLAIMWWPSSTPSSIMAIALSKTPSRAQT